MTRKEQIEQAAYAPEHRHYTYADSDVMSFIEGAEWADTHPFQPLEEQVGMGGLGMIWQQEALIKKACNWLKNFDAYRLCVEGQKDYFIECFRKAMEE